MIENDEFKQLYDDIIGLQTNRAILAYRNQQFEAENRELHEGIGILEARVEERKERIRAAALAEYERSGKKKLPHGIGIRSKETLKYSEADALNWAISKGLALKLDAKVFEKNAVSNGLPFVTVIEGVAVTFPTDLSKLLEE